MIRQGTSSLEVMFAVLIFGVGMTSVAGLFPAAATIQRNTFEQMVADQVAENTRSLIDARGFSAIDLAALGPVENLIPGKVYAIPPRILNPDASEPAQIAWSVRDRGYPSTATNAGDGDYYWVPLVQRHLSGDWRFFVFILKRSANVDYGAHIGAANPDDPNSLPVVRAVDVISIHVQSAKMHLLGAEQMFRVGDQVLGDRGDVLTVTHVEGDWITVNEIADPGTTRLWFAEPQNGVSPTRQILQFGNEAVRPW